MALKPYSPPSYSQPGNILSIASAAPWMFQRDNHSFADIQQEAENLEKTENLNDIYEQQKRDRDVMNQVYADAAPLIGQEGYGDEVVRGLSEGNLGKQANDFYRQQQQDERLKRNSDLSLALSLRGQEDLAREFGVPAIPDKDIRVNAGGYAISYNPNTMQETGRIKLPEQQKDPKYDWMITEDGEAVEVDTTKPLIQSMRRAGDIRGMTAIEAMRVGMKGGLPIISESKMIENANRSVKPMLQKLPKGGTLSNTKFRKVNMENTMRSDALGYPKVAQ